MFLVGCSQQQISSTNNALSVPTPAGASSTSAPNQSTVSNEVSPVLPVISGSSSVPQFIALSFDGSRAPIMWKSTMNFAQKMKEKGIPLHFTYFISGVYLLDYHFKNLYHPPEHKPGTSNIGFADSDKDVIERVGFINQAIADGHEIASHVNGHFNGSQWSLASWSQEFDEFKKLLFHIADNNNFTDKSIKINMDEKDLVGFRAPELGLNNDALTVIKNNGMRYDASMTAKMGTWPYKISNGLWNFPLARLTIAHLGKGTLSMDFNFYTSQTGARDILKRTSLEWSEAKRQVVDTYMNEFNTSYKGNRAPIIIGHHFSLWNDGLYWDSMKEFATATCGLPDVRCVSMRELADYLDAHPEIIPPPPAPEKK